MAPKCYCRGVWCYHTHHTAHGGESSVIRQHCQTMISSSRPSVKTYRDWQEGIAGLSSSQRMEISGWNDVLTLKWVRCLCQSANHIMCSQTEQLDQETTVVYGIELKWGIERRIQRWYVSIWGRWSCFSWWIYLQQANWLETSSLHAYWEWSLIWCGC